MSSSSSLFIAWSRLQDGLVNDFSLSTINVVIGLPEWLVIGYTFHAVHYGVV